MNVTTKRAAQAASFLLLMIGCGSDGGVDAGTDADATADAGTGDAGTGDAGPVTCAALVTTVGGTTETDALVDAPARCGQAAHTWLRDETLGDVVSAGSPDRFTARTLAALAEGAGATLPRAPGETVLVRTVRYLTQDRGALVEATATFAYPEVNERGAQRDVLLFLHGTSGFTAGCGTSDDAGNRLLSALLASYGYLVVAPDYLGLESGEPTYDQLHPYLVGQATAIASLDAVRAAAKLDPSDRGGACVASRVVTFGGSQGGHAALWVDRLLPYYARELTHLGVVATVPPADLVGEVERALVETVDASANTAAFYATAPYWYGHGGRLSEVFVSPFDVDAPAALRASCSPSGLGDITTLSDVFTGAVLDAASAGTFLDLDPWGCILRENGLLTTSIPRLGGEASSYGIFFVTSELDTLVHTPVEREAFRALCESGVPTSYLECEGAGHADSTFWALGEILRFIDARVAGEAFVAPASCEPPAASHCEGTP